MSLVKTVLGRRRLAPRLLGAILIASTCLALLATIVQLTLDYRRDLSEIDAEFQQIESSYIDSLANSMWSFDNRQTRLQLDGMLKIRDVQYAEVRGHAGELFEAGHQPVGRSLAPQYVLPSPDPRQPSLGTLTVVVGLDGVYGRLIDRSLVILATQAIKTFLIGCSSSSSSGAG